MSKSMSERFIAGELIIMEEVQDRFFSGFSEEMTPFKQRQLKNLMASDCYIPSIQCFKRRRKK